MTILETFEKLARTPSFTDDLQQCFENLNPEIKFLFSKGDQHHIRQALAKKSRFADTVEVTEFA